MGEPTAGVASIRVYFDVPKAGPRLLAGDPDSDGDQPLGLLLTIGRLVTTNGGEIAGVGVRPDVSPTCPAGQKTGTDEDCLLAFAQAMLVQARDAQRSTLLSAAKTLSP